MCWILKCVGFYWLHAYDMCKKMYKSSVPKLELHGFNVMWRQVKHSLLCHQGNHCLLATRGSVCEHLTAGG